MLLIDTIITFVNGLVSIGILYLDHLQDLVTSNQNQIFSPTYNQLRTWFILKNHYYFTKLKYIQKIDRLLLWQIKSAHYFIAGLRLFFKCQSKDQRFKTSLKSKHAIIKDMNLTNVSRSTATCSFDHLAYSTIRRYWTHVKNLEIPMNTQSFMFPFHFLSTLLVSFNMWSYTYTVIVQADVKGSISYALCHLA